MIPEPDRFAGCLVGQALGDAIALSVTPAYLVKLGFLDEEPPPSADLGLLLSAFGACAGDPAFLPAADFDSSGCVELSDLAELLGNFGE